MSKSLVYWNSTFSFAFFFLRSASSSESSSLSLYFFFLSEINWIDRINAQRALGLFTKQLYITKNNTTSYMFQEGRCFALFECISVGSSIRSMKSK